MQREHVFFPMQRSPCCDDSTWHAVIEALTSLTTTKINCRLHMRNSMQHTHLSRCGWTTSKLCRKTVLRKPSHKHSIHNKLLCAIHKNCPALSMISSLPNGRRANISYLTHMWTYSKNAKVLLLALYNWVKAATTSRGSCPTSSLSSRSQLCWKGAIALLRQRYTDGNAITTANRIVPVEWVSLDTLINSTDRGIRGIMFWDLSLNSNTFGKSTAHSHAYLRTFAQI